MCYVLYVSFYYLNLRGGVYLWFLLRVYDYGGWSYLRLRRCQVLLIHLGFSVTSVLLLLVWVLLFSFMFCMYYLGLAFIIRWGWEI